MQKRFYVEIVGIWSTYLWLLFSSGAFLTSGLYGGRMQMSFCCTQRVKLTRSFSALKRASKGSVVGLSGRHSHKLSHIDSIAVFCHKGESLSISSVLRSIHSYRERVLSALYVTLKYIFMWITKAGTLHLQADDWKKQHSTSNSLLFFSLSDLQKINCAQLESRYHHYLWLFQNSWYVLSSWKRIHQQSDLLWN